MATYEKRPKSRADRELEFGRQIYETFLDSLAEMLSLRVTVKEAGRQLTEALEQQPASPGASPLRLPRGSELRDLAFDLAQLQVQSVRELTKIGRHHTDFLRGKLEERKDVAQKRSEDAWRHEVLVTLELVPGAPECDGEFSVMNATASREKVILPQVLTFRSSDGKQAFFAKPQFDPAYPVLGADEEVKIKLTVQRDSLPGDGTYLAQAPVSLGSERRLELFIQVQPKK